MNERLIATFEQDYPDLSKHARFETGDGWYDLIRDMFAAVDELVKQYGVDPSTVSFSQIKEKFATLTAYYQCPHDALNREIGKVTHIYMLKSRSVCEDCSSPGSETTDARWSLILCESCKLKRGRK